MKHGARKYPDGRVAHVTVDLDDSSGDRFIRNKVGITFTLVCECGNTVRRAQERSKEQLSMFDWQEMLDRELDYFRDWVSSGHGVHSVEKVWHTQKLRRDGSGVTVTTFIRCACGWEANRDTYLPKRMEGARGKHVDGHERSLHRAIGQHRRNLPENYALAGN